LRSTTAAASAPTVSVTTNFGRSLLHPIIITIFGIGSSTPATTVTFSSASGEAIVKRLGFVGALGLEMAFLTTVLALNSTHWYRN
jgi:hypothetical protein